MSLKNILISLNDNKRRLRGLIASVSNDQLVEANPIIIHLKISSYNVISCKMVVLCAFRSV